MLARRMALAIGLLVAVAASQLPEFVQQYRQRLGGALDELRRAVARFDAEAQANALSREEAVLRLKRNADRLVSARGADAQEDLLRESRLEEQQAAFATSGPMSRYWIFLERLDPAIARQTWEIYRPAVPVTPDGFATAAAGLVVGWAGTHLVAAPFRRRRSSVAA